MLMTTVLEKAFAGMATVTATPLVDGVPLSVNVPPLLPMLAELVWPVPGGHMKELFSPGRREQGQFVGADVAGGRLPPVPRKVVVPPVPGVTLMIPPVPRKVVVPPVPGVTL